MFCFHLSLYALFCVCLCDKYRYVGGDTTLPVTSIVGNRIVFVDEQSK